MLTYDDVESAAAAIEGVAHRTPVLRSRLIDELVGAQVFFKCENLQRTGSFKFRGAYHAISRLDPAQRRAGVVAFSSGNHAQAIAFAAARLEVPATIVMPHDASPAKLAATRDYGASVISYDRYTEDRARIGRALADERGLTLIPPYDHPDVIAGQGTATRELLRETGPLDAALLPLGGGGLLAGAALAVRALAPDCLLYGVEPEAGDDGRQSFRTGAIVRIDPPRTIADGAQTPYLGELTFPIIRRDVTDVLTASDAELVEAMRLLASRAKLVVEPTGCLGLAALRTEAARFAGARVGVVLSGGNIDLSRYAALLASDLP